MRFCSISLKRYWTNRMFFHRKHHTRQCFLIMLLAINRWWSIWESNPSEFLLARETTTPGSPMPHITLYESDTTRIGPYYIILHLTSLKNVLTYRLSLWPSVQLMVQDVGVEPLYDIPNVVCYRYTTSCI